MGPKGHLRSDRTGQGSPLNHPLYSHFTIPKQINMEMAEIKYLEWVTSSALFCLVLCAVLLSVLLDAVNMEIIILVHKAC